MSHAIRFTPMVAALAIVLLPASLLLAQAQPTIKPRLQAPAAQPRAGQAPAQPVQAQPAQPQQQVRLRPIQPDQAQMAQSTDQQIAQLLLINAEEEVAMARFALENAKHDSVKKLAQMMDEDHGKSLAALRKFAGNTTADSPARRTDDNGATGNANNGAAQPQTEQPRLPLGAKSPVQVQVGGQQPAATATANATATAGGARGLNFVAIHRQMADECLAWNKQELGKREGTHFDIAFTGQQIDRHMEGIVAGKVLRQYASPQLQSLIDDDVKAAQHHYDMAREIMENLRADHDSAAGTSRK